MRHPGPGEPDAKLMAYLVHRAHEVSGVNHPQERNLCLMPQEAHDVPAVAYALNAITQRHNIAMAAAKRAMERLGFVAPTDDGRGALTNAVERLEEEILRLRKEIERRRKEIERLRKEAQR